MDGAAAHEGLKGGRRAFHEVEMEKVVPAALEFTPSSKRPRREGGVA